MPSDEDEGMPKAAELDDTIKALEADVGRWIQRAVDLKATVDSGFGKTGRPLTATQRTNAHLELGRMGAEIRQREKFIAELKVRAIKIAAAAATTTTTTTTNTTVTPSTPRKS